MKYKLIIATWLALLPLCLFGQVQQVQSTYSSGNQSQNGNICVAGIPATNANNIKNTGYSTTIGFLSMDEDSMSQENVAPVANAGIDQAIIAENEFTLDGTASFDSNNDELTYLWTSLDGLALQEATTSTPTVSTEQVKAIRQYRFVLTVNDGEFDSKPDTVSIAITHPDWIPETATNSATFYGVVTFEEINAEAGDWVAAYIGGVNRGISQVKVIQNQPYVIFNIQADMEGMANFKLYDASTDQICEVASTTLIIPGFDIGTPDEPIALNGTCNPIVEEPQQPDTLCNLVVSQAVICAGKTVTAEFNCTLSENYTYEWDFDSATIISGEALGPYELKWETGGIKKVTLLTYQNGQLISTTNQPIEVFSVDLQEKIVSLCTGDTYEFNGQSFTESTFYIGEFTNQNGCDSLVLLNLIVSDTACQSTATFSLAGNIVTEDKMPIKEVMVDITEMENMHNNSNDQGTFLLKDIPYYADSSYTIRPQKLDSPLNGVTTLDLVLISKFILGLHKFDSPYQYIAADINKSGTITAIDIVELRQYMLSMTNQFPENNAWRFVDASFEFPAIETTNPLTVDFPETITPDEIPTDSIDHNFVAVKIGDIDGNVSINNSRANNEDQSSFQINISEQEITMGETSTIQLTGEANHFDGFQFTLQFDPNLVAIRDIKELLLKQDNIGFTQIGDGLLHFSWIGKTDTDKLIELEIEGKATTTASQVFRLSTRALNPEAYTIDGQIIPLAVTFLDLAIKKATVLYQNEPNPFNQETKVQFYLPESQSYQFNVLDINGRILNNVQQEGVKGVNVIIINQSLLKNGGIYYYQLITDNWQSTKKMILVD